MDEKSESGMRESFCSPRSLVSKRISLSNLLHPTSTTTIPLTLQYASSSHTHTHNLPLFPPFSGCVTRCVKEDRNATMSQKWNIGQSMSHVIDHPIKHAFSILFLSSSLLPPPLPSSPPPTNPSLLHSFISSWLSTNVPRNDNAPYTQSITKAILQQQMKASAMIKTPTNFIKDDRMIIAVSVRIFRRLDNNVGVVFDLLHHLHESHG